MRIDEVSKALSDEDKARIHKAMGVEKDAKVKPLVQLARDKNKKETNEEAPPGMEKWIKDRKPEFKKRYGDSWQQVLYATAWKQYNNK
jgi:hypothetical protein